MLFVRSCVYSGTVCVTCHAMMGLTRHTCHDSCVSGSVFATSFAQDRHFAGYRAISPAGLAYGPARSGAYWSTRGYDCSFLCYLSRSPVHSTGNCAGTEPARCLQHRPNSTFHRPGPEPLAARGNHWSGSVSMVTCGRSVEEGIHE
jgi:hypothetical protein